MQCISQKMNKLLGKKVLCLFNRIKNSQYLNILKIKKTEIFKKC